MRQPNGGQSKPRHWSVLRKIQWGGVQEATYVDSETLKREQENHMQVGAPLKIGLEGTDRPIRRATDWRALACDEWFAEALYATARERARERALLALNVATTSPAQLRTT